jgi:hypothetical protein
MLAQEDAVEIEASPEVPSPFAMFIHGHSPQFPYMESLILPGRTRDPGMTRGGLGMSQSRPIFFTPCTRPLAQRDRSRRAETPSWTAAASTLISSLLFGIATEERRLILLPLELV